MSSALRFVPLATAICRLLALRYRYLLLGRLFARL
jgi:hypothetical protein